MKPNDPSQSAVDDSKALAGDKQTTKPVEKQRLPVQEKSPLNKMHVKVYSPFRDYFDGAAYSLTAENLTGPFDILPKHHNFISLLKPSELLIRLTEDYEEKVVRILISGGIIHVKADEVLIFLNV